MEEIKNSAETSEETSSQIDKDAVVSQETSEEVNDFEFKDTQEEKKETSKEEKPKVQTPEQNSENARRRREAERQAELKATREKTIIETLKGKNPYTNEEMKDSADVEEYLTMREIEEKGGDPLADFSKFQKEKNREKSIKLKEEQERAEWYENDKKDFQAKHPEVNLGALIQDKSFQLFSSGKVGTLPLSEIYEGFMQVTLQYEKQAKEMAKQMLANKKASPGALSSSNIQDNGYFTREQVQKMSQEEVHKNYDKIRASMQKWK